MSEKARRITSRALVVLYIAAITALTALAAVSLVEYNIADAAVVLLYGSAMGLSAPALSHRES